MLIIVARKNAQRFAYLAALYVLVDGSPFAAVPHQTVIAKAGLTKECGDKACHYLLCEGLITAEDSVGGVRLTHSGIREYEASAQRSFSQPMIMYRSNTGKDSLLLEEEAVAWTDYGGRRTRQVPLSDRPAKQHAESQMQDQQLRKSLFVAVLSAIKRNFVNSLFDALVRYVVGSMEKFR